MLLVGTVRTESKPWLNVSHDSKYALDSILQKPLLEGSEIKLVQPKFTLNYYPNPKNKFRKKVSPKISFCLISTMCSLWVPYIHHLFEDHTLSTNIHQTTKSPFDRITYFELESLVESRIESFPVDLGFKLLFLVRHKEHFYIRIRSPTHIQSRQVGSFLNVHCKLRRHKKYNLTIRHVTHGDFWLGRFLVWTYLWLLKVIV